MTRMKTDNITDEIREWREWARLITRGTDGANPQQLRAHIETMLAGCEVVVKWPARTSTSITHAHALDEMKIGDVVREDQGALFLKTDARTGHYVLGQHCEDRVRGVSFTMSRGGAVVARSVDVSGTVEQRMVRALNAAGVGWRDVAIGTVVRERGGALTLRLSKSEGCYVDPEGHATWSWSMWEDRWASGGDRAYGGVAGVGVDVKLDHAARVAAALDAVRRASDTA